jgi:hypothetical protein
MKERAASSNIQMELGGAQVISSHHHLKLLSSAVNGFYIRTAPLSHFQHIRSLFCHDSRLSRKCTLVIVWEPDGIAGDCRGWPENTRDFIPICQTWPDGTTDSGVFRLTSHRQAEIASEARPYHHNWVKSAVMSPRYWPKTTNRAKSAVISAHPLPSPGRPHSITPYSLPTQPQNHLLFSASSSGVPESSRVIGFHPPDLPRNVHRGLHKHH